ncbi:glutathione S-transferase family protein [Leptospira sp. GIMC2001]|uniref:glutathione S-transferase family protein n=1 Tax=Leptospira sp. GIMC2001 TaxID=1513297 RepID=UPI00234B1A17|nr:glutathione S-transferase family protein [Leptospira sp. GIMC2001]WCL50327.1 glutathione S-transferase family protein [Leptospira sp. GIMC2001]
MIKIHGFPTSNYYNKVKLALLEKEIEFEEVRAVPTKSGEFLDISPMGRIPIIEVNGQFVRETQAILEFLEEEYPDKLSLLPKDNYARARVREITLMTDNYFDLAVRPLFPYVFFGKQDPPTELVEKCMKKVRFAWTALSKVIDCQNFAVGDEFSFADITAMATWVPVQATVKKIGGFDIFENHSYINEYLLRIQSRPKAKEVLRSQKAALRISSSWQK